MIIAIIVLSLIIVAFGFVVFWGAPYVPSHKREVEEAFDTLYPLTKKDTLIDIGSGDGIVLQVGAAKAASAVGYELNPLLVWLSKWRLRRLSNVEVYVTNFWKQEFPEEATIVYIFSVSRDMEKLAVKMQAEANRMRHPLHLIIYAMELPDRKPVGRHRAHLLYLFTPS